tara:strand:+ start:867 stop:1496 length:630 start_codon:yes stop_codon:yes gene_type:complete
MASTGMYVGAQLITADMLNASLIQTSAGTPTGAGQLGRFNYDTTNNILYYDDGSAWVVVIGANSAVTPMLRSLGSGAFQGAAGNHTHSFIEVGNSLQNNQTTASISDITETTVATVSRSAASANHVYDITASVFCAGTDTYTMKIVYNSIAVVTESSKTGQNTNYINFVRASPETSSTEAKVTVTRTAGSSSYIAYGGINVMEIKTVVS